MPLAVRRNRASALPQGCALSECMALLGGTWTPNVIWHLSAGARRFGELRADLAPISAKVLSARLHDLERKGVLTRHRRPTSPPSVEYALTDLGLELMPAIRAIVEVGLKLKDRAADRGAQGLLSRSSAAA
jgi:DNA-binding HxlR family transcriptional regulator